MIHTYVFYFISFILVAIAVYAGLSTFSSLAAIEPVVCVITAHPAKVLIYYYYFVVCVITAHPAKVRTVQTARAVRAASYDLCIINSYSSNCSNNNDNANNLISSYIISLYLTK